MNTTERQLVRALLNTTRRLPDHATLEDNGTVAEVATTVLDQLALAEEPFTKDYKCYDQAERAIARLDQYVTRREQENWTLRR